MSFIASNSAQSVGLTSEGVFTDLRVSSPLIRLNPWDSSSFQDGVSGRFHRL